VCGDGMSTMAGKNKALIASLAGVELVLSALGNHFARGGVQMMSLHALASLAVNGSLGCGGCCDVCGDGMSTMAGKNKALIASLAGVELVLSALGNHSSHVGIQDHGLRALANLAVNGSLGCGDC